jgi:preprotein translocase SecE subunit
MADELQQNQSTKKNKKKKDKQPNKFISKIKDTNSELKRVTWPTFGETVKQTGGVLGFVLAFVVVLLGINALLSWIFSLITASI